jgi:hypothetical protein
VKKQRTLLVRYASLVMICLCLGLTMASGTSQASTAVDPELMAYVNKAPGTWYTGKIDAIDGKVVAMDDINRWFTSDVIFVSRYGFKITRRDFYEGKKVKMLLNSDYECSILMEI